MGGKAASHDLGPGAKAELRRLEGLLASGTFGDSELRLLFQALRFVPDASSLVIDVGHCVAHRDRNKGDAHGYVKAYIDKVVEAATIGGTFGGTFFSTRLEILEALEKELKACSCHSFARLVKGDRASLLGHLPSIFDGVYLDTGNAAVKECILVRAGDAVNVTLQFQLDGPNINVSPSLPWSVTLIAE